MPFPEPEPGLVVHYDYLWQHEHESGFDEGTKSRPCVIVVAVHNTAGVTEVVVAPITHVEPKPPAVAIEVPPRVKEHLGLDGQRSWVIVTDLNSFFWPGFDLRPIPNAARGTFAYGFLPPKLHRQIAAKIDEIGSRPNATKRD